MTAAQVNLLVLYEAFSPATPRLLREAAALLSPQSVSMPVQQAEHVTPITGGGSSRAEQQPKALYASVLQLANTGVCMLSWIVCLSVLTVLFLRQCPTSVPCWRTVYRPQQPLQGGLMLSKHHRQQPCTQGPHDVQACCPPAQLLSVPALSFIAAVQASQQLSWPS